MKIVAKSLVYDDGNNVLVLFRGANDNYRPSTWDLPGGSVDDKEDPTIAAEREVFEEAGIHIRGIKPVHVCTEQKDSEQVVTIIFKATCNSTNVILSHEHVDYKWVNQDKFAQLSIPDKYKRALELSQE